MSRYFTSDFHLGSLNILKYANRPFSSAKDAMTSLLINVNSNLKRYDTLIHVGDFMLSGMDRHDNVEDSGLKYKINDYLDMFEPNLILLSGNHDDGRNCETIGKSMVIDLNQNYRNVSVSHYPSYHKLFTLPNDNCWKWFDAQKMYVHVHLCGHVHDKWLLNFDAQHKVLNVNVGVDVWNYKPVRDSEITELLDYFRATLWTKINPKHGVFTDFTLTRDALEKFKISHSKEMKEIRAQRKQEKLKKKGLTPEECERRRIEAMKAKGLI